MKQIFILVFLVMGFSSAFSQKAKGYLVTDSVSESKYYIKQGAEIVICKSDVEIRTTLDSISNSNIYSLDGVYNFNDIEYLRYQNHSLIKKWLKTLIFTSLISGLLVGLGFLLVPVFIYSFVLIASGFLGLVLLIPIIVIFILKIKGVKIQFHK